MKSLVKIVDVFFSGIEYYGWYDTNINGDYYAGNSDCDWEDPGKLEDFFSEPLSREEAGIGYAIFVAKNEAMGYGYECFYPDEVLKLGRKLLATK